MSFFFIFGLSQQMRTEPCLSSELGCTTAWRHIMAQTLNRTKRKIKYLIKLAFYRPDSRISAYHISDDVYKLIGFGNFRMQIVVYARSI